MTNDYRLLFRFCFYRLLSAVQITIDHRPSTINHQPSTIDHRPSTIDHQPSTINHRPSTINHQPSTIDRFCFSPSLKSKA